MNGEATCATCIHCYIVSSEDSKGECRFSAPQQLVVLNGISTEWPEVSLGDSSWCSRHQLRVAAAQMTINEIISRMASNRSGVVIPVPGIKPRV